MEEIKKEESKYSLILDPNKNKSAAVRHLKEKTNFLYKTGKPFVLIKSGNSYSVTSDYFNTKAFEHGFSPDDLRFIKSVKKYAVDNDVALKFIDTDFQAETINYIQVKEYEAGEFIQDLVYIDINSAYWQTAYRLGIISQAIYKKGMTVGKKCRLASLGSLAKCKHKHVFNGKEFEPVIELRSYATENLWFAICKAVSDVMNKAARVLGDDFIFYWVDGIYIKNNARAIQKVTQVFLGNGYSSKMDNIPEIRFTDKGFQVQGIFKDDVKEYSWSKSKNNQPLTDYVRNRKLVKIANELIYKK